MKLENEFYCRGRLWRYTAKLIKGKWLVSRAVYNSDGYYNAGLSYTNEVREYEEVCRIFEL